MGSPKKQRKKFSKPAHPWQKERILAEKELLTEYGLNRKYEIWKMNSILKNFTRQAKNLVTSKNPQVEKERNQLLTKLFSLGLLGKDASIENILSLTLKDIMERRLQTLVFRKNLANSMRQSRQFIVHEHISLGDKRITAPSYLVPSEEEGNIQFAQGSVISNTGHPIRAVVKAEKKGVKSKETAKDDKKTEVTKEAEKKEQKKETKSKEDAGKSKISGTHPVGKTKVPSTHDLKKQKEKSPEGKKDTKEKEGKKPEAKKK